ncbi:MAG: hypothetical protein FWF76_06110 [Oscillospiraceae bacterium]|nr:hypothetical protein [Oscillospiraceae bacterium]
MKGLGVAIFGVVALLIGVAVAVALIRKRRRERFVEFDDFDTEVDDEEFEHFFGTGTDDKNTSEK